VREEAGEWSLRGPDGDQHKGRQAAFKNAASSAEDDATGTPAAAVSSAGEAAAGASPRRGAPAPSAGGAAAGASPRRGASTPSAGGAGAGAPPRVSDLALPAAVLGWTRGEPLRVVARLATARASFALSNRRGEVARLARDDVALLRGERVAARF